MKGEPQLHFHYMSPQEWVGKTTETLAEEAEALRRDLKAAAHYTWDSTHFYIDDVYGRPTVRIAFYKDRIYLWNARNGILIPVDIHGTFSEDDRKSLSQIIRNIENGLTLCYECQQWVAEIKRYSFAGGVCTKCYNPKKHLPPDTRGD